MRAVLLDDELGEIAAMATDLELLIRDLSPTAADGARLLHERIVALANKLFLE